MGLAARSRRLDRRVMPSDIEHWHINATVHKDRVEETYYVSDAARNIRRERHTKVWHVEQFLGRGGFGDVRLERNKADDTMRAVKRIAIASTSLRDSDCEKELKALLEFSKPKSREAAVFVDFFGWFRDGSDLYIAMEYVKLGDLERNVSARSGKISEAETRDITKQILSGLKIMHAESFAHRDLKPQNVLVVSGQPDWWIKLADFGLSKKLTDTTAYHTRAGTQSYMAPEVLNYLDAEFTNAVDLWAVGCIAYRLITGVVPFPPGTSLMKYCEDKSMFPDEALYDGGVKIEDDGLSFIRQLLTTDPKERLSAPQALQHQWIISGGSEVSSISSADSHISIISPSTNITISPPYQQTSDEFSEPTQSRISPSTSITISPPIKKTPEPPESTLSAIRYDTVSHDGLKSHQSTSSEIWTPGRNDFLKVNPKSKRTSRSRHSKSLSPVPSVVESTRSRRKDRTPEEQVAHDQRKAERHAIRENEKEPKTTMDDESNHDASATVIPIRQSSQQHTGGKSTRSKDDGKRRPKLLDVRGESVIKAPFMTNNEPSAWGFWGTTTEKMHKNEEEKQSKEQPFKREETRERIIVEERRTAKPRDRIAGEKMGAIIVKKKKTDKPSHRTAEEMEARTARKEFEKQMEIARAQVAEDARRRDEKEAEERQIRREERRKLREEEERQIRREERRKLRREEEEMALQSRGSSSANGKELEDVGVTERRRHHSHRREGETVRKQEKPEGDLTRFWSAAKKVFTS